MSNKKISIPFCWGCQKDCLVVETCKFKNTCRKETIVNRLQGKDHIFEAHWYGCHRCRYLQKSTHCQLYKRLTRIGREELCAKNNSWRPIIAKLECINDLKEHKLFMDYTL